ncbi:MAG: hypothetical protein ACI9ES_002589, partial [Oceanospirillaceae bacterium]
ARVKGAERSGEKTKAPQPIKDNTPTVENIIS